MLGFLSKLFGGSKSQKDVKAVASDSGKGKSIFSSNTSLLSNDELRGKTVEFKQRIQAHLTDIDAEIENLTN